MSRRRAFVPWWLCLLVLPGLAGLLPAPGAGATPGERGSQASALIHSVDVLRLIGSPVTDPSWEQVARIDRVLFDPADGRATFVVLSFVGREDLIAVPWDALSIDELGQARLKSPRHAIDNALRFYGERSAARSVRPTPYRSDFDEIPRLSLANGEEGWIQGRVIGRLTLPASAWGVRRVMTVVEAGGRSLRIDLGSEEMLEAIGLEVVPGEWIQVQGSFGAEGEDVFIASAVRSGARWVSLDRSGGPSASRE